MACTIINNDGSVTFYWKNPIIPTNFKQFVFYNSNNGIDFNKLDSSSIAITNNYTHQTLLGNISQQFYYVEIVSQTGESSISDTIGTMFFQLDNNAPDFNKADLYWTKVADIPPDGSNGWHQIYWDYPDGNWNFIDSSQNDNYSMDVTVCFDSIIFKIELENSFCSSISNIRGDWFKDVEYPQAIGFDSISIIDSKTVLGWTPSQSPDVVGYILYRNEQNTWLAFDTVAGISTTFYTDTLFNPCEQNHEYAIAAIDSCGNKSEGSFLQPQRPILFYDIGYNVCNKLDTLIWEQYENPDPALENYLVWRSDNGGSFVQIAAVQAQPAPNPPAGISADQMWFIDKDIIPGTDYKYFIQAAFGGKSSSSCIKEINSYSYIIPDRIYFANADVLADNQIELNIEVDTTVYSCVWEIYRSDIPGSNGNMIYSVSKENSNSNPLNYLDGEADPQSMPYDYYAIVNDSCGFKVHTSNILSTIHLQGSKPNEQTNRLNWSPFGGWETEVEKYYIFRISGTENGTSPIDSVDAFTFNYDDIIDATEAASGKFTYWIEAVQKTGGNYNYGSHSNSNRIDLYLESSIFFPNAFKPSSTTNNEFKPIFNFFSGSDYLFQVYNRWGHLIFVSEQADKGWDGFYKNKKQESGVFIYRLSYKNVYGISVEQKGSFMLVE
jgi:gliding motility-associated-like protein